MTNTYRNAKCQWTRLEYELLLNYLYQSSRVKSFRCVAIGYVNGPHKYRPVFKIGKRIMYNVISAIIEID